MNTELTDEEREKFNLLLMKAVDGELSGSEEIEFRRFTDTHEMCMSEWKKFGKLKEVVMNIDFKDPPEEIWDSYWGDVYNRLERGIGWILLSIGCVILFTYGSFKAIESVIDDPTIGLIVKGGIITLLAGIFVLFVSTAREKLFMRKRDKYRGIRR